MVRRGPRPVKRGWRRGRGHEGAGPFCPPPADADRASATTVVPAGSFAEGRVQWPAAMPHIRFRLHTPLQPDIVVGALTDFGPGRADVWPNIDAQHFQVHDQGPGWADVTE